MFDIRLSQEQCEFRDLARKFAQEEIKPVARIADEAMSSVETLKLDV